MESDKISAQQVDSQQEKTQEEVVLESQSPPTDTIMQSDKADQITSISEVSAQFESNQSSELLKQQSVQLAQFQRLELNSANTSRSQQTFNLNQSDLTNESSQQINNSNNTNGLIDGQFSISVISNPTLPAVNVNPQVTQNQFPNPNISQPSQQLPIGLDNNINFDIIQQPKQQMDPANVLTLKHENDYQPVVNTQNVNINDEIQAQALINQPGQAHPNQEINKDQMDDEKNELNKQPIQQHANVHGNGDQQLTNGIKIDQINSGNSQNTIQQQQFQEEQKQVEAVSIESHQQKEELKKEAEQVNQQPICQVQAIQIESIEKQGNNIIDEIRPVTNQSIYEPTKVVANNITSQSQQQVGANFQSQLDVTQCNQPSDIQPQPQNIIQQPQQPIQIMVQPPQPQLQQNLNTIINQKQAQAFIQQPQTIIINQQPLQPQLQQQTHILNQQPSQVHQQQQQTLIINQQPVQSQQQPQLYQQSNGVSIQPLQVNTIDQNINPPKQNQIEHEKNEAVPTVTIIEDPAALNKPQIQPNIITSQQLPSAGLQQQPTSAGLQIQSSPAASIQPVQPPQQQPQQPQQNLISAAPQQPPPQKQQQPPNTAQTENMEDEDDDNDDGEDSDVEEVQQKYVETSPSGRFKRFDEELGRGAYKNVYKGVDLDTGREVAWSVINLSRLPKSERPRIKSEVKILKELHHQNIITFINAWICKEDDKIHFITEMITGGSLRQYIKRMGSPKLKVIKNWCTQILQGLKYLHEQKIPIIHRDIKCDNIFINSNTAEIKIGDLGLSTTMKHSYTSSVLGTPEFMAPELYEEYYGTEVDIYAFGMALLEMLTREAPYAECSNPAQIYRKVINRDRPLSLGRIKDTSVRDFILLCIHDRQKRPTAKELLDSEFITNQIGENNNKPCEIYDKPMKTKIPRQNKLYHRNALEAIPEGDESKAEEMEIQSQNKQVNPNFAQNMNQNNAALNFNQNLQSSALAQGNNFDMIQPQNNQIAPQIGSQQDKVISNEYQQMNQQSILQQPQQPQLVIQPQENVLVNNVAEQYVQVSVVQHDHKVVSNGGNNNEMNVNQIQNQEISSQGVKYIQNISYSEGKFQIQPSIEIQSNNDFPTALTFVQPQNSQHYYEESKISSDINVKANEQIKMIQNEQSQQQYIQEAVDSEISNNTGSIQVKTQVEQLSTEYQSGSDSQFGSIIKDSQSVSSNLTHQSANTELQKRTFQGLHDGHSTQQDEYIEDEQNENEINKLNESVIFLNKLDQEKAERLENDNSSQKSNEQSNFNNEFILQNQLQEIEKYHSDDQQDLFLDNKQINLNSQKESESSKDSPNQLHGNRNSRGNIDPQPDPQANIQQTDPNQAVNKNKKQNEAKDQKSPIQGKPPANGDKSEHKKQGGQEEAKKQHIDSSAKNSKEGKKEKLPLDQLKEDIAKEKLQQEKAKLKASVAHIYNKKSNDEILSPPKIVGSQSLTPQIPDDKKVQVQQVKNLNESQKLTEKRPSNGGENIIETPIQNPNPKFNTRKSLKYQSPSEQEIIQSLNKQLDLKDDKKQGKPVDASDSIHIQPQEKKENKQAVLAPIGEKDPSDRKNKPPQVRPEKWLNKNDLDKEVKKFKEDDFDVPQSKEKIQIKATTPSTQPQEKQNLKKNAGSSNNLTQLVAPQNLSQQKEKAQQNLPQQKEKPQQNQPQQKEKPQQKQDQNKINQQQNSKNLNQKEREDNQKVQQNPQQIIKQQQQLQNQGQADQQIPTSQDQQQVKIPQRNIEEKKQIKNTSQTNLQQPPIVNPQSQFNEEAKIDLVSMQVKQIVKKEEQVRGEIDISVQNKQGMSGEQKRLSEKTVLQQQENSNNDETFNNNQRVQRPRGNTYHQHAHPQPVQGGNLTQIPIQKQNTVPAHKPPPAQNQQSQQNPQINKQVIQNSQPQQQSQQQHHQKPITPNMNGPKQINPNHPQKHEVIPIMIEINDLEINFNFHTNKDTIDKVAIQFFSETKLDQKHLQSFKDGIKQQLDIHYSKQKAAIQQNKQAQQVNKQKIQQTVKDNQQNTQQMQQIQPHNDIIASNIKKHQVPPQQQIVESTNYPNQHHQNQHKPQNNRQDNSQANNNQVKLPVNQPNEDKQDQIKQPQQPQVQVGTGGTGGQPTPGHHHPHHTEEFIRRRDEIKQKYKAMNQGIREFFKIMNIEKLDIKQALDAMDYQDQKDRKYKHDYINHLKNVHTNFLIKKPIPKQQDGAPAPQNGNSGVQGNILQQQQQQQIQSNATQQINQSNQLNKTQLNQQQIGKDASVNNNTVNNQGAQQQIQQQQPALDKTKNQKHNTAHNTAQIKQVSQQNQPEQPQQEKQQSKQIPPNLKQQQQQQQIQSVPPKIIKTDSQKIKQNNQIVTQFTQANQIAQNQPKGGQQQQQQHVIQQQPNDNQQKEFVKVSNPTIINSNEQPDIGGQQLQQQQTIIQAPSQSQQPQERHVQAPIQPNQQQQQQQQQQYNQQNSGAQQQQAVVGAVQQPIQSSQQQPQSQVNIQAQLPKIQHLRNCSPHQ